MMEASGKAWAVLALAVMAAALAARPLDPFPEDQTRPGRALLIEAERGAWSLACLPGTRLKALRGLYSLGSDCVEAYAFEGGAATLDWKASPCGAEFGLSYAQGRPWYSKALEGGSGLILSPRMGGSLSCAFLKAFAERYAFFNQGNKGQEGLPLPALIDFKP